MTKILLLHIRDALVNIVNAGDKSFTSNCPAFPNCPTVPAFFPKLEGIFIPSKTVAHFSNNTTGATVLIAYTYCPLERPSYM
jgi:hypothetical protein